MMTLLRSVCQTKVFGVWKTGSRTQTETIAATLTWGEVESVNFEA